MQEIVANWWNEVCLIYQSYKELDPTWQFLALAGIFVGVFFSFKLIQQIKQLKKFQSQKHQVFDYLEKPSQGG